MTKVRVQVTAERSGLWWALQSDNGAFGQVRALAQVHEEMIEAVAHQAGVAEEDVEIDLKVIMPDGYEAALSEAQRQRRLAEEANRRSAAELRRAARTLVEAGISYRDAAQLMGVSHQRIAQLV